VAVSEHSWTAFARTASYALSAALRIDTLQILRKHMDVDTCVLTTPFDPDVWAALAPSNGIVAYRDAVQQFSGPITARQLNWDPTDGRPLITVECVGDIVTLADRLVMPNPTLAADNQTVNDYWIYTGVTSTAMWRLISDQAGPTCYAPRRVPGLVMGADPGVGTNRTWQQLFDAAGPHGVLDELAVMSVGSGANLGVRVTSAAGQLTFDVVQPRDLTGQIRFSADMRNLVGIFYREQAPTVTNALVAGQGDLHARLRKEVDTADPLATRWGRQIWSYIDRRDTADTTVLTQAGADALAQGTQTVSLTVTLTDTQAATYLRDWDLGDQVTVYVGLPGQAQIATVADVIRQISLSVDNTSKEVIQPAIGTYDATAIIPTPTQQRLAVAGAALRGLISNK